MKHGAAVIHVDPEILNGTPVFAGTRVPIQTLLEYLKEGRPLADFLQDFPTVALVRLLSWKRPSKRSSRVRVVPRKRRSSSWTQGSSTIQDWMAVLTRGSN